MTVAKRFAKGWRIENPVTAVDLVPFRHFAISPGVDPNACALQFRPPRL